MKFLSNITNFVDRYLYNESYYAACMDQLENDIDTQVSNFLKDQQKPEEILERIRARREQLHIKPEFTPEVVGVCKQILVFGSSGIGIMVAFSNRFPELSDIWAKIATIAGLFYLNLTLTSLLVLIWFFLQARSRYPFLYLRKLGNTKPFFYYETNKSKVFLGSYTYKIWDS